MNEVLNTILNRRSIRNYKPEQIKDQELEAILEAGKFAPSAANQQSWHFTVVQNKEMLKKINDTCKDAFKKSGNKAFEERAQAENFSIFYNAPTYIIVTAEEKALAPQNDGSLALGNMFLAAKSLGIGSCWVHAINFLLSSEAGQPLKKELGIPDGYIPVGSGAFGYVEGESPAASPRRQGTVNWLK